MNPFLRSSIRAMSGYTPGEQPRDLSIIKLNTNESPYPPSPRVFEAIREHLTADALRRYPDPLGTEFRQAAGKVLGIDPDGILIGNGSDDILTILTRAHVPEGGLITSLTPSYLLYKTLAQIQNARYEVLPFGPGWTLPHSWGFPEANLTYIANPNSPSGTRVDNASLSRLASQLKGPVVIDEAYADFAEGNALSLIGQLEPAKAIVTRTMSKSYGLAGIRFGFAVAHPSLIQELIKVKDSYNCDVLSLTAATAAILDQEYLHQVRDQILSTRQRMERELSMLGFQITPSQANFVWCQLPDRPLKPILESLKQRRIYVRHMIYAGYGEGLRISVGTEQEIDCLMKELQSIL